ncbi:hypothetical protein AB0L92_34350, partial [Streptomyces sp. NPDC051994]
MSTESSDDDSEPGGYAAARLRLLDEKAQPGPPRRAAVIQADLRDARLRLLADDLVSSRPAPRWPTTWPRTAAWRSPSSSSR